MVLHVRGERGRRAVAPIANRALERFLIVMRFHVDLQVIAVPMREKKKNKTKIVVYYRCGRLDIDFTVNN